MTLMAPRSSTATCTSAHRRLYRSAACRGSGRSSRMGMPTMRGRGHGAVLATPDTIAIMKMRYGEDCAGQFEPLDFGVPLQIDDVTITLHAGRAYAGLGAGADRASRAARRRDRRLQAAAGPDGAAVRAGGMRSAGDRGDVRAAGVPASRIRRIEIARLLRSVADQSGALHMSSAAMRWARRSG